MKPNRATQKVVTEEAIYLAFMLLSFYREDVIEDSSLAFFEDKLAIILTSFLKPLRGQLMKFYDETIVKKYVSMMEEVFCDPYLKVPCDKYESERFNKCLNRYTKDKKLELQLKTITYEVSRTLL